MTNKPVTLSPELIGLLYRTLNGGDNQLTGMEHGQAFRELSAAIKDSNETVEVVEVDTVAQALTMLDFALSFALCNMEHSGTRRDVKKAQAHLERLNALRKTERPELPAGLFDNPAGYTALFDSSAVYAELDRQAARRTSAENVADVLDAVVRLIRARAISEPI